MPIKLLFVTLAVVAVIALSVHAAIVDVPDPIDFLHIGLGLGFLGGVILRRGWLRPLGLTLGGVLLLLGFMGLLMTLLLSRRAPIQGPEVFAAMLSNFGSWFGVGGLLLWCMRHRDVVRWLAVAEARRIG